MGKSRRSIIVSILPLPPVVAVFLFLLAQVVPAVALPSADQLPALSPASLTAIDVPIGSLPIIQQLGIIYQDQQRNGYYRAAATGPQLAALSERDVVYSVVGRVAIFDNAGDGGQLRSVCSAENPTDYVIPQGQWGQQHVVTQCTLDGTVDWVDIHYIINNVLFNGYPPSGQGLTEVEILLAATKPTEGGARLETPASCAVHGPEPGQEEGLATLGTYDRWIWNIDTTLGTHSFAGRPINQVWTLYTMHDCPYPAPLASIDYWGIWVYYTPASYLLDGHVQDVTSSQTNALPGVTMLLYCSQASNNLGSLLTGATSDASGRYALATSTACNYYNVVFVEPSGYSFVGVVTHDGQVTSSNWLQFPYPLSRWTLSGNDFVFRQKPTATSSATRTVTRTPTATRTATRTPTRTPGGPTYRLRLPVIMSGY